MASKQLNKKIVEIYKARQHAHDILIKCDCAIDVLLKILLK